jgi:hypothetical protein
VEQKETEHKLIYELGNGQWDIPALRRLLENILPNNTFFKGFEVTHTFPSIGKKVMILNARQIHKSGSPSESFPPIIMLAMEDITEMVNVAETLARHTSDFEVTMSGRSDRLEENFKKLENEIRKLKRQNMS